MRTVIKLAGALLEDDAVVQSISQQIAELAKEGHEILVVHGGGRLFTATLKRMGIESKFVAGLRVTDRETRDVAVMVFAGLLNKKLAAAISAEGTAGSRNFCGGCEVLSRRADVAQCGRRRTWLRRISHRRERRRARIVLARRACCLSRPASGWAPTTSCTTLTPITWPRLARNTSRRTS